MLLRSLSSLTLLALCAGLGGCPVVEQKPLPGETERRSFTANYVDGIALPRLTAFSASAAALKTATSALASSGGAAAERAAAQDAWRTAMAAWQELEVLHLGPAGSPATFVGGLGLRDRINAWPQVNLCAVDQQILVNEFEAAGWAEQRLPNVIGLAPLEYVLFVDDDGNACPENAAINTGGAWAALGSEEIQKRRARLAGVLAADVDVRAKALDGAWRGGFADQLKSAGEAGSSFTTAQQALDEVYAALFFVELVTKDKKLAVPAGLHVDCTATSCPDKAESRFSRTSKENVLANLVSTRRVFLGVDEDGKDGAGFDDLLKDKGAADLVATMTVNIDAAIAAVRAFDGSFEDALVNDPARVRAVYDAVKLFTDDFKSTLPSTLGLRVPDEGAGDND